jgi:putative inorganic carbon (HCO3(-)) transporter
MRDIVMLFTLMAVIPLIFRNILVGVMLWAWIAFIWPEDYLYGFMGGVPLNKIISGLSIISFLLSRKKNKPYLDNLTMYIILFGLIGIISSVLSESTIPDVWDICSKLLKIFLFCGIIQVVIESRFRFHCVLTALCLGLGFHGIIEGLKFIASGGNHHALGGRSIGDNNQFALAICMIIPVLLYLSRYSRNKIGKVGISFVSIMSAFAVMGTFSRGGFVGLVIVAAGTIATGKNRLRNFFYLLITGLVLIWFAPDSWVDRVDTIKAAGDDSSFMGRVVAWKMSTLIALHNPFIGAGFHAVQDPAIWNRYTPQFDTLDFIPTEEPTASPHAAHSIYFEVLGDLGFVGFAFFIAIIVTSFVNVSAIRRLTSDRPDFEWASDLANSLRISLLVYIVSGALLSMAYFELLFVIATMLSILRRIVQKQMSLEIQRSQGA